MRLFPGLQEKNETILIPLFEGLAGGFIEFRQSVPDAAALFNVAGSDSQVRITVLFVEIRGQVPQLFWRISAYARAIGKVMFPISYAEIRPAFYLAKVCYSSGVSQIR